MTCLSQQKTWPHECGQAQRQLSVTSSQTYHLLPHEGQEEILANRGKRCSRGCGRDRGRSCRGDRVTERQLDIRQVVLGNTRQRIGNTTTEAVAS